MNDVPSSKLIIRLCSKEHLPIAIPTSVVEPLTLTRFLVSSKKKPAISSERIFVDRSENCIGKLLSNTATELWLVDTEGHLPNSKEEIKACQIQIQEFKSKKDREKNIYLGTYSHKLAVEKLVTELKRDFQATGIVLGYYVDNPSSVVRKKVLYAQKNLEKSGLMPSRFEVRMTKWTGFSEIKEPKHLSVFITKINDKCNKIEEKNEIIWVD